MSYSSYYSNPQASKLIQSEIQQYFGPLSTENEEKRPTNLDNSHWAPIQYSHGRPAITFEDNRDSYGIPRETYNSPRETYNSPRETYNSPRETYSSRIENYSIPRETYGHTRESYNSPREIYEDPAKVYESSRETYVNSRLSFDKAERERVNNPVTDYRDSGDVRTTYENPSTVVKYHKSGYNGNFNDQDNHQFDLYKHSYSAKVRPEIAHDTFVSVRDHDRLPENLRNHYKVPGYTYDPAIGTYNKMTSLPEEDTLPKLKTYYPSRDTFTHRGNTYSPPQATYNPPSKTHSNSRETYDLRENTYSSPRATSSPPRKKYSTSREPYSHTSNPYDISREHYTPHREPRRNYRPYMESFNPDIEYVEDDIDDVMNYGDDEVGDHNYEYVVYDDPDDFDFPRRRPKAVKKGKKKGSKKRRKKGGRKRKFPGNNRRLGQGKRHKGIQSNTSW